jgi:guanylate kinase
MLMGKIFCLLGKSAAGKSSIEKILEQMGHKRIISSTSRPKREKEVDGMDYYFITEQEFAEGLLNDEYYENTIYNNWHYCISKKNLDLYNHDYIVVVEPHGYAMLQEKLGKENVIGIYIYINDKERLLRALMREVYPNVDEIVRRYQSDKILFKEIEENAQYKVQNLNAHESAVIIDRIIKGR